MNGCLDLHFSLLFPLHLLSTPPSLGRPLSLPFCVHLFLSFHPFTVFLSHFALLPVYTSLDSLPAPPSIFSSLPRSGSISVCLSIHLPSSLDTLTYLTKSHFVPSGPNQWLLQGPRSQCEPEPWRSPRRRSLPTTLLPSWTSGNPYLL